MIEFEFPIPQEHLHLSRVKDLSQMAGIKCGNTKHQLIVKGVLFFS